MDIRSRPRFRPHRNTLSISSHGPILHSGILSLQLLYLLHRNVKIIKEIIDLKALLKECTLTEKATI